MIPPASSWISPKIMSVSTFNQGGTPKPLVLTLGSSKQQPLPLDRSLPTPFPHQDGASDKAPPPSDSKHGRVDQDEETENLTASTARIIFKGKSQSPSPAAAAVEGTLVIAAAAGRGVELYGDKKEAGEEGGESLSPEDVSLFLEQVYHGLSTWSRGCDKLGGRRSMARSKDKSRDEKSTDGKAFMPLPDMTVSPMELSYPNDHLEDNEGDGHVTRPDDVLQLTDHASIPTGSTPAKIPPWYHSDSFDYEGPSIDPKANTEGKEMVVGGKQYSVRGIPNFYNGSAQLVHRSRA